MRKNRNLAIEKTKEGLKVNFNDVFDEEVAEEYPIDSVYDSVFETTTNTLNDGFDYFGKAEQEDKTCGRGRKE